MSTQSELPTSLRIVAALFVLGAVFAVLELATALVQGRLTLGLGILGFWIAPGLRRGVPRWRRWAVALSALQVVTAAVVTPFALQKSQLVPVTILYAYSTNAPAWIWLIVAVPSALLGAWQWWVLTRPAIRARFEAMG